MSEELDYQCVYASGEDNKDGDYSEFDEKLLNGKEWISTKYCHYPQEIIVKFKHRSNLEKIQMLCHSQYIPQKVEIFVGNVNVGTRVSMSKAKFDRLGFVSFQNNFDEKTRELKSIYVDSSGWFLKLLVHNNYNNPSMNKYDQVGLMDLIVTGTYLPEYSESESESSKSASPLSRRRNRRPSTPDTIPSLPPSKPITYSREPLSSYQPFADKNYADEMREIIRILDRKKKKAVSEEEFDLAKRHKYATDRLTKAIVEVDKLERDKRVAVEEEDFDSAQDCKDEILAIRTSTFVDVKLLQLLTEEENSMFQQRMLGLNEKENRERKRRNSLPKRDYETLPARYSPPREYRPDSNAFNRKENTVLPTIQNGKNNSHVEPRPMVESEQERLPPISQTPPMEEDAESLLHSLPERDRAAISQAINVFGSEIIQDVYSKKWERRKSGLEKLKRKLEGKSGETRENASYILQPTLQILRRGLRDKVFAVFSAALDLLNYILDDYIPQHKLGKVGGNQVAEKTYYVLITRTGDTVSIARAYASWILKPFEATGFTKIDQGHGEVAERIVEEINAPNDKLAVDEHKVCTFALSCIAHTDPDVRQVGARLIIFMYTNGNKDVVLQYLPPEGSKQASRNPLFKALFDEMDKIDGKEPRSQLPKGAAPQSGIDEADLAALRKQNKELKAALTRGQTAKSPQPSPRRASVVSKKEPDNTSFSRTSRSRVKTKRGTHLAVPGKAQTKTTADTNKKKKVRPEQPSREESRFDMKLSARNAPKTPNAGPRPVYSARPTERGKGTKKRTLSRPGLTVTPSRPGSSLSTTSSRPASSRSVGSRASSRPGTSIPRPKSGRPATSRPGTSVPRSRNSRAVSGRPTTSRPRSSRPKSSIPRPQTSTPKRPASSRRPVSAIVDKMCMFCGERNELFDEKGLDKHYLYSGPMLKKCEHCKQMTEISTLKQHYLSECTEKNFLKTCPKCKEPLPTKEYERHQIDRDCPVAKPAQAAGRCLLCHSDIQPNSDIGWRRHLIGKNGCSGNPRKTLGKGAAEYGNDGLRRKSVVKKV